MLRRWRRGIARYHTIIHDTLNIFLGKGYVPESDVINITLEEVGSSIIPTCPDVQRLRVVFSNCVIRLYCQFSVDVELLYFRRIIVG